jgi:glutaredoxin-related protein
MSQKANGCGMESQTWKSPTEKKSCRVEILEEQPVNAGLRPFKRWPPAPY